MKTRAAPKLICQACQYVRRHGKLFVRCPVNAKHKQVGREWALSQTDMLRFMNYATIKTVHAIVIGFKAANLV